MNRGKTRRAARLSMMLIVFMLLGGLLAGSPQAGQPWKISSIEMAGADATNNNTVFVYDRYLLFAPYAPSKMPSDAAAVSQLDNHFIYLVDSKRPSDGAQLQSLETPGGKVLFYPTKLIYDENTHTAYLRGTRYEPIEGGVQEVAVLAYFRVNLDDNGKPTFGNIVMIDIAGFSDGEKIADAPDDFSLAFNGNLLVFTNGLSIFTYKLDLGYLYQVNLVTPEAYNAGSHITYLEVDKATNNLTVYWNGQTKGEDGNAKNFTELSFYNLDNGGTMQLNKRAHLEQFPEGVYLTAGSNIQVFGSPDSNGESKPSFALLVTSDGNLSAIDLTGPEVAASLKPLAHFDSMALNGSEGSPRVLKYDTAKRTIGIVKQGYQAQARKPSNGRQGRPGSVIRSLSLLNSVEPPALAVGRLGKNLSMDKLKVISNKEFTSEFASESGLTPIIDGQESQWLLATYSGNVVALSTADTMDAASLSLLTQVGPRTGRIAYFASRNSLVAINSFGLDSAQEQINEPGELVLVRGNLGSAQTLSLSSAATVTSNRTGTAQGPTLTARRPCNINKR